MTNRIEQIREKVVQAMFERCQTGPTAEEYGRKAAELEELADRYGEEAEEYKRRWQQYFIDRGIDPDTIPHPDFRDFLEKK